MTKSDNKVIHLDHGKNGEIADLVTEHFSVLVQSLAMENKCKFCAMMELATLAMLNAVTQQTKPPTTVLALYSDIKGMGNTLVEHVMEVIVSGETEAMTADEVVAQLRKNRS